MLLIAISTVFDAVLAISHAASTPDHSDSGVKKVTNVPAVAKYTNFTFHLVLSPSNSGLGGAAMERMPIFGSLAGQTNNCSNIGDILSVSEGGSDVRRKVWKA